MKCDRAAHLDLAAFLAGESSPEVEEFRAHYPVCPDCSTAVRGWMALHAELDPLPTIRQHPSEELLLRFESEPDEMSAVARSSVETHLTTCASCRDELQALRRFDFSILQPPATDTPQAGTPGKTGKRSRWRDFFAPARQIVLHPAFAYGLALLLLLPQLSILLPNQRGPDSQEVRQFAIAPQAESDIAAGAAPEERKRRNEPMVDRLADVERPQRLHGTSKGVVARDDRGTRSRPEPGKDIGGQVAAPAAAPFAKEKREAALAARQATDTMTMGIEEAERPSRSAEGQVVERSRSHDAASERTKVVTIQMDPSGRNNIPMQGMLDGAILHIRPQQPVSAGSDVAIRIKSADGRRELREIHTASGGDDYLNMTVPPGWMPDGVYSVEVWPLDSVPKNPWHRHGQESFTGD